MLDKRITTGLYVIVLLAMLRVKHWPFYCILQAIGCCCMALYKLMYTWR